MTTIPIKVIAKVGDIVWKSTRGFTFCRVTKIGVSSFTGDIEFGVVVEDCVWNDEYSSYAPGTRIHGSAKGFAPRSCIRISGDQSKSPRPYTWVHGNVETTWTRG